MEVIDTATQQRQVRFTLNDVDELGVFERHASVYDIVDEEDDIFEPGAFAKSLASGFAKNGVPILVQHEEHLPIGKSLELREDDTGLYTKGFISPTSTGLDYRLLVKDRVITGLSIGYIVIKYFIDDSGIRHITEAELTEISLVTYPANTEAQITSYKSLNKGGKGKMDGEGTLLSEVTLEQFTAAVSKAVSDGMASQAAPPENEGQKEAPPASEQPEGEKPDEGVEPEKEEKGTKSVSREGVEHKARQPEAARKYADVYIPKPAAAGRETKSLPPGIRWARCMKAMTLGKGDPEHGAKIVQQMYGDASMQREIKALTVTNPTGGGFLVPETYSAEIIPLLKAKSVVRQLGATVVPMESGNLTMPKMAGGTSSQYVGEMRTTKESEPSIETIKLSAKKLMTKCIISNDLMRSASMQADQLVLDDALEAMALRADEAALMGKGTEFEPRGLLNIKDIGRLSSVAVDEKTTGKMIAALMGKNVETSQLGWTFNSILWDKLYNVTNAMGLYIYREGMENSKLNGHQFAVSNQLPVSKDTKKVAQLILGRWKDFLIGEQLSAKTEIWHEGTIVLPSGKIISAVDHDCTIMTIISLHDFGVRHEESFVVADIETA